MKTTEIVRNKITATRPRARKIIWALMVIDFLIRFVAGFICGVVAVIERRKEAKQKREAEEARHRVENVFSPKVDPKMVKKIDQMKGVSFDELERVSNLSE